MPTPDPLAALNDIHLPPPVATGPPELLIWIAFAVAALALSAWFIVRYRRLAPRRLALAELGLIGQRNRSEPDAARLLADVSVLLRRLVLARSDDARLATASGLERVRQLSHFLRASHCQVLHELLADDAPYRPTVRCDTRAVLSESRRLIVALTRTSR